MTGISNFMDRTRRLPLWQQRYLLMYAMSHVYACRKHGYETSEKTWNEMEEELSRFEENGELNT